MRGRLTKCTNVIQQAKVVQINIKDLVKLHHTAGIQYLTLTGRLIAETCGFLTLRDTDDITIAIRQTEDIAIAIIYGRELLVCIISECCMVSCFARSVIFHQFLGVSVASQGCYPAAS